MAPRKSAAQLDREIAIALANTRREASDDTWDVAMDAILEHDPKRAAQIAHEITGDGVIEPPPSFLRALHKAPAGVRRKFEEYFTSLRAGIVPTVFDEMAPIIGHTKSGKPIYGPSDEHIAAQETVGRSRRRSLGKSMSALEMSRHGAKHVREHSHGYTEADHEDARAAHMAASKRVGSTPIGEASPLMAHISIAQAHQYAANSIAAKRVLEG